MKRVAVVEDNPDNRLLVEAILEDEFELELFEDGIEAVAGIPQFDPDVILLDISLPGMDGKEVLRRLRAEPRTSAIPVIAFTAHAMYGDREDLLALERHLNLELLEVLQVQLDLVVHLLALEFLVVLADLVVQ